MKLKLKELPVLLSFFLISFIFCFKFSAIAVEDSSISDINNIVENISYIILAISVCLSRKYKIRELLLIGLVLVLGAIVKFTTGYGWVLFTVLLIVSSKDVRFELLCKTVLYGVLSSTIFVLMLYFLGVSDAGVKRRGFYGYGFSHPNNFSEVIMVMSFILFYLKRSNKRLISFWSIIIAIGNYFVLGNRSVTVLLLAYPVGLYILGYLYKNQNKKKFKLIKNVLVMAFPFCQIFSIATAILYVYVPALQRLSLMLNSRIFEAYYNLNYFGYSLFGKVTNFTEFTYDPTRDLYFQYNVLDNSYIGVLIEMGIIATIIWGITHFVNAKLMDKNQEVELLAIYILTAFFGLMESSFRIVVVDFTFLYLFTMHTSMDKSLKSRT